MTTKGKKGPTSADKALGLKVRQARNECGISQQKLGEELGVTFQQVQKYEKGVNRVGAARLQQIAKITGKSITWFLAESAVRPTAKSERIAQFMASREGCTVVELMANMRPETQTEIVAIVRAVSRLEEVA